MAQTNPQVSVHLSENRVIAPLQVVALHRRMNRHSNALLVTANDAATYVVKFARSETPLNAFREAFGNGVGTCLGIPMTPWAVLRFSREALTEVSKLYADPQFLMDAFCEDHFGSRVFVDAGPTFEVLPSTVKSYNPEVTRAFAAVLLFDLWIGQSERRQYIARLSGEGFIDLRFIRNSRILTDKNFQLLQPERAKAAFREAYRISSARAVCDSLMKRLFSLPFSVLEQMLQIVPSAWMRQLDMADVLEHLHSRRAMIESLWYAWKKNEFDGNPYPAHAKISSTEWMRERRTRFDLG